MKRQKHKPKTKKKSNETDVEANDPTPKKLNRRDFLGNSLVYSVAIAAVAGTGSYFVSTMIASARESKLGDIGNGLPTVVQIHDPSCPTCNALLGEARDATCAIGEDKLQFRVANLNTDEGYAMAKEHGVGKITLLLFDGQGKRRLILRGMNEAENLIPAFERHVAQYGVKS